MLLARLGAFAPGPRFNVEAVAARPTGLAVHGVTAEDRRIMRDWRNRLADLVGFRHPHHDTYEFHMTFAYPVRWLDDAELPAWQALFDEVLPAIAPSPAPFTSDDYRQHVDGRARADGVRTFLRARGIVLPEGAAGEVRLVSISLPTRTARV